MFLLTDMTLKSNVNVVAHQYGEISFMAFVCNANTSFIFTEVFFWHKDCLWSVEYKESYRALL